MQAFGQLHHFGVRIHAQNKFAPGGVPPVQLLGVGEIGVAPDGHAAGHLRHQLHRPINPLHTATVAGDVARTVDQIQHLFGVGQAHNQRRVTPNPLVGNVPPFFALAVGLGNGPIHVDKSFF